MSSDGQERTQKATPQRMKELHKKGNLGRSHDLAGWLAFGAAVLMAPTVASRTRQIVDAQLHGVADIAADPSPARLVAELQAGLIESLQALLPMFAVVVVVVVLSLVAQGGVHPRFRTKWHAFQPAKGIKRLFSSQILWEAVKTFSKSLAVGLVVFASLKGMIPALMGSGRVQLPAVLTMAGSATTSVLRAGLTAGLALAVLDLVVVIRRNLKQSKMTLKEVKDEAKRTDGDPHVKGAIRARQRAMSRNRMMAAVVGADVVVVNPTHVAVALRYEPGKGAPTVVAKGADELARKIRERASEHRIPMVADIPLARALYAACEVDEEIPEYLFMAVARVLAFVMALRRKGAASGEHRSPGGTTLPEYIDADHVQVAREHARAARASRIRVSSVTTTEVP